MEKENKNKNPKKAIWYIGDRINELQESKENTTDSQNQSQE